MHAGQHKAIYDDYLATHFGIAENEKLICLTEIQLDSNSYYDVLGDSIKNLTSYVIFVNAAIKNYLKS